MLSETKCWNVSLTKCIFPSARDPLILYLLWHLWLCFFPVSDSLAGENSLLHCDLLPYNSPHGNQSVSALPSSSCSSAPLGSDSGCCLEELPPSQGASGKTSSHFTGPVSSMSAGCLEIFQSADLSRHCRACINRKKKWHVNDTLYVLIDSFTDP